MAMVELAASGTVLGGSRTEVILDLDIEPGFTADPSTIDSDGDGLTDDWEDNGIPYTANGVDKRYPLPGANKLRKDVFVEVDTMSGVSIPAAALQQVVDAFANAPIENGGGQSDGIALHLVVDEQNLPYTQLLPMTGNWPTDFSTLRSFGTADDRAQSGEERLFRSLARARAYRYALIADRTAGSRQLLGAAELAGDNFVVFAGNQASFRSDAESFAATFMHELGHSFGLEHGGGDDVQGKPNYPSIMNYTFADRWMWNSSFWRLDYSRAGEDEFPILREDRLNEWAGIGRSDGIYRFFQMPFGANDPAQPGSPRVTRFVRLNGSPVDYGSPSSSFLVDGVRSNPSNGGAFVQQDLNHFVDNAKGAFDEWGPSYTPPGELRPHNDWEKVATMLPTLLRRGELRGGSGPSTPTIVSGELTVEQAIEIDATLPPAPPACLADVAAPFGTLDIDDVLVFLSSFNVGNSRADLVVPFDVYNIDDVLTFLLSFNAGCPGK